MRAWLSFGALLAAATCASPKLAAIGEGCLLDSDCSAELVCVFRRCHVRCATSKDCAAGERCMLGQDGSHVCQPDIACKYHSDCPDAQVCGKDERCRDECVGHRDCLKGQLCKQHTCTDPEEQISFTGGDDGKPCLYNSECPAPLRCSAGKCLYECDKDVDCASGKCTDHVCVSSSCVSQQQSQCACPQGGLGIRVCGSDGKYGPCLLCECKTPQVPFAGGVVAKTIRGVGVTMAGARVIAGSFTGTQSFFGGTPQKAAGGTDVFLVRIADNGAHQFSLGYGSAMDDDVTDLVLDEGSNVVLVGTHAGPIAFGGPALPGSGLFLAKLDPAGKQLWGIGPIGDLGDGRVAKTQDGSIVVIGTFAGTLDLGGGPLVSAGDRDLFVARFSSSGSHVWSKRFGNPGPQPAALVAVDGGGNAIVAGALAGAIDFGGGTIDAGGTPDVLVFKLDAGGAHVWSKRFDGGAVPAAANAVSIDNQGNILVAGSFGDTIDFGNGPMKATGERAFVVALKSDGAHASSWSLVEGTRATAITPSSDGNLYLAGSYSKEGDVGPCKLPPLFGMPGLQHGFVAKLTLSGLAIVVDGFGDLKQQAMVPKLVAHDASSTVTLTLQMKDAKDGSVTFGPKPGGPMAKGTAYVATYSM